MLKKMLGVAAVLALGSALPAHAATVSLSPDASWHEFDVSEVLTGGLGWFDINTFESLEFTITVPVGQNVKLTVVDAGFAGDRFEVRDNGQLLGVTSLVDPNSGLYAGVDGLDFDAALANSGFSRGFFFLGAGTHTITGLLAASFDGGNNAAGAIAAAPVPLPAGALLLLSGGGLMGLFGRRRKPAAA